MSNFKETFTLLDLIMKAVHVVHVLLSSLQSCYTFQRFVFVPYLSWELILIFHYTYEKGL